MTCTANISESPRLPTPLYTGSFTKQIMLALSLLLLVLILTLRYFLGKHFNYWKVRGFPFLEPNLPFGNLRDLCIARVFPGEVYQQIYDQFPGKKYVGIFHILRPVLVVRDPEEVKNVLTKNFDHFASRDEDLDPSLDFMSQTLFHMQDSSHWKFLRSGLARAFTSSKLRPMVDEMVRFTNCMAPQLAAAEKRGDGIEIKELASQYTTRVCFSCFYGLDVQETEDLKNVQDAVATPRPTTVLRVSLYNISTKLPLWLKVRLLPKPVTDFFKDLAQEIVTYRESTGVVRKDMFDELLQSRKKCGFKMQDGMDRMQKLFTEPDNLKVDLDTIAAQCFLFYVAAFDSSAFTISACLRALAEYPSIQNRLLSEIDQVLESHNGQITYEAVQEMTYLDQVVAETLRLMPAVPELVRKCCKSYRTTEGLEVEEGVRVVIPVYALHRDPTIYPDPLEFKPERERPQYAYLPFGQGPRSCLGMRFGLLQTKIGLISILKEYSVSVDPKCTRFPVVFSPKMFVISVSEDGFWVKLQKRKCEQST